jgi:hypothetical protein
MMDGRMMNTLNIILPSIILPKSRVALEFADAGSSNG